jgi:DNA (cytosine-5)-methyltransferase 1
VKPRLLDLFCGAGGATHGYQLAGFEVVGIDHRPQPNYCGDEFIQADALEWLWDSLDHLYPWNFADAIHASPPCPAYSTITPDPGAHPDLVAPTRALLEQSGVPWVMENVPGAPMGAAVVLCGSMFGLGANGRQLRRHRLFEVSGFSVMSPPCNHRGQALGVYGTGGAGDYERPTGGSRGYKGTTEEYREAMGIDWATRAEIAQAIPPAYTEHIGGYLLNAVQKAAA